MSQVFRLADHLPDPQPPQDSGRNTQFALAACRQAWNAAGLRNRTTRSRPSRHLPRQRRRSLDFDAYTALPERLASWKPETNSNDAVKWAQVAMGRRPSSSWSRSPTCPSPTCASSPAARPRAQLPHRRRAASTQAIGEAAEILRRGDADVMIGGGAPP